MKNALLETQQTNVHFGNDILEIFNENLIQQIGESKQVFILCDSNTYEYCYPTLKQSCKSLENADAILIEDGESAKNLKTCEYIWNYLFENNADKESLFINLGGGKVSDIGSFVSALFKRGITFINIPTSLLSMVDASVGGKNAINFGVYKNQIGTFYFPKDVYIYPAFLNTLPSKHLLSGFAEMLKHALILDASYWKSLVNIKPSKIIDKSNLIFQSVRLKQHVITIDKYEKSYRKILNFGHTFGHAFESLSCNEEGVYELTHGEAVAAGIVCESYLAFKNNLLKKDEFEQISSVLTDLYSESWHIIAKMSVGDIKEIMLFDKKNRGKQINYIPLLGIGMAGEEQHIASDNIKAAHEYLLSAIA